MDRLIHRVDGNILFVFLLVMTVLYTNKVIKEKGVTLNLLKMMSFIVVICAVLEVVMAYIYADVSKISSTMLIVSKGISATLSAGVMSLSILLALFVYTYVERVNEIKRIKKIRLIVPAAIVEIMIIISNTITAKLKISDQILDIFNFHIGTIFSLIILLLILLYISERRELLRPSEYNLIVVVTFLPIFAMGIQLVLKKWLITFELMMASITMIFIYLQDTIVRSSLTTNVLKKSTFDLYTQLQIKNKDKNIGLIYFVLEDYENIYKKFDKDVQNEYLTDFVKLVNSQNGNSFELVSIGMGKYLAYFKTIDMKILNYKAKEINDEICKYNTKENKDRKYNIKVKYQVGTYNDSYNSVEDLLNQLYCNIYEEMKVK